MKQIRRYEKHYNGIQIDDSSSHSTLQLSSHGISASSSSAVRTSTITKRTTFLRQQLVLILLIQRYNPTRLRFANQSATTTLLKDYMLRQRTWDLCNSFHGDSIGGNVMIYTFALVPMGTKNCREVIKTHWLHHYNNHRLVVMLSTRTLRIDRESCQPQACCFDQSTINTLKSQRFQAYWYWVPKVRR